MWWGPFCTLIDHLQRWEMAIIRNSLSLFWFPIILILVLVGTEYACFFCLLVGLWHLHHFSGCYFASVLLMARSQEVLLIFINLNNVSLSDSLGIICRANDKLLTENYLSDMVLTENFQRFKRWWLRTTRQTEIGSPLNFSFNMITTHDFILLKTIFFYELLISSYLWHHFLI